VKCSKSEVATFTGIRKKLGDIIKDINAQLTKCNFDYQDLPIGGFGSVHLFIAQKK